MTTWYSTVSIRLTRREKAALEELARAQGLTEEAVLRQGLRMYQLTVAGRELVEAPHGCPDPGD